VVTRQEFITFAAATLNNIFDSGVVSNALNKAIGDLGWAGCQPPAPPPSSGKNSDKKSAKKSGKEEGAKEKGRRPIGPYMLFMSMVMERINKDPSNPAFKVEEKTDENGQPVPVRGGKMTVASRIWASMSETSKQAFNATFKPLCDQLNSEALANGAKHDIGHRIPDFLNTLSIGSRKQLEDNINNAVNALAKGKGANGTPGTAGKATKPAKSSSSDSSSSEDESEEPAPPKPTPKAAKSAEKEKDKKRKKETASAKKEKKKAKKPSPSSSSSSDEDSE